MKQKDNGTDLSASLEDYIEAILHVENEKKVARSKDLIQRLSVKRASVTGALRALSKKKLIHYTPYDVITLSVKGKAVAQNVVRRHEVLYKLFVDILQISPSEAERVACGMEHEMSKNVLSKLLLFVEFIGSQGELIEKWKQFSRNHT